MASADEANRRWEECRALVDQLRVENAALRAALSQAQLLPAGIGGQQPGINVQQQQQQPGIGQQQPGISQQPGIVGQQPQPGMNNGNIMDGGVSGQNNENGAHQEGAENLEGVAELKDDSAELVATGPEE